MTRGNKGEKKPIDFLLTAERERKREGKEGRKKEGRLRSEDDARWRDGVIEKLSYFDNVYRTLNPRAATLQITYLQVIACFLSSL